MPFGKRIIGAVVVLSLLGDPSCMLAAAALGSSPAVPSTFHPIPGHNALAGAAVWMLHSYSGVSPDLHHISILLPLMMGGLRLVKPARDWDSEGPLDRYWATHMATIPDPARRDDWVDGGHRKFVEALQKRGGWKKFIQAKGYGVPFRWKPTYADWSAVHAIVPEYVIWEERRLKPGPIVLTPEQELALGRLKNREGPEAGDPLALEVLMISQFPLVDWVAQKAKYYSWMNNRDDEVRHALMFGANSGAGGLWRAVERFDPEKHLKLGTMAEHWVNGAFKEFRRKNYPKAVVVSLDENPDLDPPAPPPDPILEHYNDLRQELAKALPYANLTPRELRILELLPKMHEAKIGAIFGVTEGRIGQIKIAIIRKIQKTLKLSALKYGSSTTHSAIVFLGGLLTGSLFAHLAGLTRPSMVLTEQILPSLPLTFAGHLIAISALGLVARLTIRPHQNPAIITAA